ncbi:hypothetical protein DS831_02870 [Bombilactobacillus bombi]|uniref:DUF975 family protein n=1 Tax=Bombilactobacillus bombi TaxID=1303590 RepID=A0A3R6WBS8_9LACO|nr:DUF975 family protein [Bombilactobacillus bombi]RHW52284.1 hypothetical protein DS831_02870 [Bombilactobacillus bombi]
MDNDRLKTRAELKQEVKELYRGNWKTAIKLNLFPIVLGIIGRIALIIIISILIALISYLVSRPDSGQFTSEMNNMSKTGSNSGGIVWNFVVGLINMSIMFTTIDWLRTKEQPQSILRDSFSVFSKRYFIGALVIEILKRIFIFLWALLLIVPGIVKNYSYSQASYIFKDAVDANPNSDVNYFDCITRSRKLMNGRKWRLFILQLSFLGWEILNWIVLGLGSIWLIPYKNATYAAFYKDLTAKLSSIEE